MNISLNKKLTRPLILFARRLVVGGAAACAFSQAHAEPEKIRLLLDWAWLPYHAPFVIAQAKHYYEDAGLDVTIDQGRGSENTALLLSQDKFDIAHLNVTNAAQMIGRGGQIKVVNIYQHKSGAAFIGIKGKVNLSTTQSLIGPKIGSTPGGSDALSLKIFTHIAGVPMEKLNIVSLDSNAKTTALFGGKIDAVSGDAPAYESYVHAAGQQPETLLFSDHNIPLIGFGFAVNDAYLAAHPQTVKKFLAATQRAFQDEERDPAAACSLMASEVHLAGSQARCIDYVKAILALSTSPSSPDWGKQSPQEWTKLLSTLREVGALKQNQPVGDFYTNNLVAAP
jgi:NitT/TauT family transport system substrate-binding protein